MKSLIIIVSVVLCSFSTSALACTCTLGLNTIAFGIFYPLNKTVEQLPVNMSVTCSTEDKNSYSMSYTVEFASGHGTIASRHMDGSSSDTLNYNLYKDSGYSETLGSGSGNTYTFTDAYTLGPLGCASPCTKNYTIYSEIPVQPLAFADRYSDSLTVTLNYTY